MSSRIKKAAKEIIFKLEHPIKAFREWKDTIKTFREWKNEEKEKQEKGFKKEEQEILTPEEMEELDSAAYSMSRKWKYNKLMKAANLETAKIEGREVHGWMQRIFHHRYQWLINHDVFDYAVHYALMYYNPEIFCVIKDYDFDNATMNLIHLPERTHFDIFDTFEYDKFVCLTPKGEPFENAVHWIENYPWVGSDGYSTTKTLAPCNFLNTGYSLWDLPVLVLKDAVGMDKLFFQATTTADQITRMNDQILKTHIYKKRQKEKTTDEKMLEMEIKYDQLEERHQYLIDNIKAGDTRNAEEKLKDFAKKYDKETSRNIIDWKKIALGIIIVLLAALVIFGCVYLFAPKPGPSEIPETARTLTSNLFNRGC